VGDLRAGIVEVLRAPWIQTTWALLEPEYRFVEFCAFLDRCVEVAFVAAGAHCDTRVSGVPELAYGGCKAPPGNPVAVSPCFLEDLRFGALAAA
jgi:hypothetical protein